jgi:hypothetical protein
VVQDALVTADRSTELEAAALSTELDHGCCVAW